MAHCLDINTINSTWNYFSVGLKKNYFVSAHDNIAVTYKINYYHYFYYHYLAMSLKRNSCFIHFIVILC